MSVKNSPQPSVDRIIGEDGLLTAKYRMHEQYTRALLLILSVSHLVVWCHANHTLDVPLITTLKSLDEARKQILPLVERTLSDIPDMDPLWSSTGN